MSLFTKQTTQQTQVSNYSDTSANAGAEGSVAVGGGAVLDTSDKSSNASTGDGGLSLSNATLTLNTTSDAGAIDLAKELSLKALDLSSTQTSDLKGYVKSNQDFARSVAETALATASGQPIPQASNKLLYVGGAVLALVLFLVLGRRTAKA